MADKTDESQLDKLTIITYPDQKFGAARRGKVIRVLFNPSEYTYTRSYSWPKSQAPGTSKPSTSKGSGNADQLSLTLFFDGTGAMGESGPVTDRVREFLDLMRYQGAKHGPPYLWVYWGPLDFRCCLKTATATYTLFNRKGEPIRARVSASFEEVIQADERRQEEQRASPDLHRVWRVEEGQSLDTIAQDAYDDVRYWREIARVNGLENPRSLQAGQLLRLPPKER